MAHLLTSSAAASTDYILSHDPFDEYYDEEDFRPLHGKNLTFPL